MKPIQIYVTEAQHQQLKVQSAETGQSVSDIVRERLFQQTGVPNFEPTITTEEPPKRTIIPGTENISAGDILKEIDIQKRARDEELEHCQDPDTRKKITQEYQENIDNLWAHYHELKD